MSPFSYAIWLMPCEEQRAALQSIIDSLAARFGMLGFAPHATLCSGMWERSESELVAVMNRLSIELPVELSVDGVDWTERWSTYFFLRLRCGSDWFERSAGQLDGAHLPAVGPHLSLLYHFGEDSIDREALRNELAETFPKSIRFDSLALVRPSTGRWEDVADWKPRFSVCD